MTDIAVCLDRSAYGFFGKIPARGDFVRSGLPGSFVTPWDEWMSRMLTASQSSLGIGWRDAWMQAPIWCFALDPGVCGPDGALGLWMPSTDRSGRLYPLTIAAVVGGASANALALCGGAFVGAGERAGLEALDHDLTPETLAARLADAAGLKPAPATAAGALVGASLWWTDGAPLVPRAAFAAPTLPARDGFTRMLDAGGTEMLA